MTNITHRSSFRALTVLTVVASAIVPFVALAADASDNVTPIANNVLALVNVLVTIVFTLSIVVFGWGIVQFILAAGDPAAVSKAKSFLLWGVIGMAVGASIFGLVAFLRTYFGVSGGTLDINLPQVK